MKFFVEFGFSKWRSCALHLGLAAMMFAPRLLAQTSPTSPSGIATALKSDLQFYLQVETYYPPEYFDSDEEVGGPLPYAPSGDYAQYYLIPGPPDYSYSMGLTLELVAGSAPLCNAAVADGSDDFGYPTCDGCDCSAPDEVYLIINRYDPDTGAYYVAGSYGPKSCEGTDPNPYDVSMYDNSWDFSPVDVQGTDILEIKYDSSGNISEYEPSLEISGVSCTLSAGDQGEISYYRDDLPADPGSWFLPDTELSKPDNFDVPQWEFVDGTETYGCSIDADTGKITVGSATGTLQVECYDNLQLTSGILDYPAGLSDDHITLTIGLVAPPQISYVSGLPFAGGGTFHHKVTFAVSQTDTFADGEVQWSVDTSDEPYTSTLGCEFEDSSSPVLTVGDEPASGSESGTIVVAATDSTGYEVGTLWDIYPQPAILVDRTLAPTRQGYAIVNEPDAFEDVTWSISSRTEAADCTIAQDYVADDDLVENYPSQTAGIVQPGNDTGTIIVSATDTDGYTVNQQVTINQFPTLRIFQDGNLGHSGDGVTIFNGAGPAYLVDGNDDEYGQSQYPFVDFSPGDYATWGLIDYFNVTVASGPTSAQIGYLSTEAPGASIDYCPAVFAGYLDADPTEPGTLVVKVESPDDGWSFTQPITVHRVPFITYEDDADNILGAWGQSVLAFANDFDGTPTWTVGGPNDFLSRPNVPIPPAAGYTADGMTCTVTSGTGWSDLPYFLVPQVNDDTVINYGCGADPSLEVEPTHAPTAADGPTPTVVFSDPVVPTGGSFFTTAWVDHPEQMNAVTWTVSPPSAASFVVNADGTITIMPGNTPVQAIVSATDNVIPGYSATGALDIDQADITFSTATVLVADGSSHTTASLSDTVLFGSVTWTASSGSSVINLAPRGSPDFLSCLLTAGMTAQSRVTLTATCNDGSQYQGYYVQNSIDVRPVPTVSFSKSVLIPGSQATAQTSDNEVFPPAATTWHLVSGPSGVQVTSSGAITVPTGTASGTIEVQAESANYTITGSITVQSAFSIQFSPSSLPAGSHATGLATVPGDSTATFTLIADPSSTGTTITPNGLITAGAVEGTVTIQASDPNGYTETSGFVISPPRSVVFATSPLLADGQSRDWASIGWAGVFVEPSGALEAPVWSIQGQSLGCLINPTTGEILSGKFGGEITVRASDPASSDYITGILKLKSDCLTSCNSGHCAGGGGSVNDNSVDVNISLGYVDYGRTEVSLGFEAETPSASVVTPQLLSVNDNGSADVEIITNSPTDPTINQVKTATMLAVVQVVSASSYNVKLYSLDQLAVQTHVIGTPYVLIPGVTPFCVWNIANPTLGNYNNVVVTETRDGTSYVAAYTYQTGLGASVGNGWDMLVDGGTRLERRTKTSNPVYNTETYSIMDPTATTVYYQEVRAYQVFPWNQSTPGDEELTSLTVGTGPTALTTTWSYYTDLTDTDDYGHVSQVSLPDGSWETYQYDNLGRQIYEVSQFMDNPLPVSTEEQDENRVTSTIYYDPQNISEQEVTLQGTEISHTYTTTINSVNGSDDEVIVTECQNHVAEGLASLAAPGNLSTTNFTYASGNPYQFQSHATLRPDQTAVIYSYEVSGGVETKTVMQGLPVIELESGVPYTYSGVGYPQGLTIADGSEHVTEYDDAGNVASDEQFDTDDESLPVSSKIRTAADVFGRPLTYVYGDGSSETMNYDCCGMATMTDRSGVQTSYTYDDMKRPAMVTEAGLSKLTQYNEIGKVATVTQITPDGNTPDDTVVNSYQYDTAGRQISSTDLIGATTTGFSTDASGHTVVTTTYPNGSTKIETYYFDGSRLSTGGTAVYPATFGYGVDSDGAYKMETNVRVAPNEEWAKGSLDMLGRQYKVSYPPNASGATPYSEYYYSQATGQLWKEQNPDGVITLYSYNDRGQLFQKAVDMDQNGVISTSVDRVQQFATSVEPNPLNSGGLEVNYVYSWDQPATGSPVETQTLDSAGALDGSYTNISSFSQNDTTVTSYNPAAQTKTITETRPDHTQNITVYVNHRLASVTIMDSSTPPNQLSQTTYQYYSSGVHYGMLQSTTDARNGATSYTYNAAGEEQSISTPAPGGGNPLLTQYSYDDLDPSGRVETITLPDGSTVTRTYELTGEQNLITGSQVVPTQYTYEQGRVKTITTWTSYGNPATAETTTFNYTPDRGFLQSKSYAGSPGPSYTYFDSGSVKTRAWPGGPTTTYTYNNAGDLATVSYSDGTPGVSYTYNARGEIATVTDEAGTCTKQYYSNGFPYTETYSGGPLAGIQLEYDYDSDLRRQNTIVRENGAQIYQQGNAYNPGNSYLRDVTFGGVLAQYGYENNAPLVSTLTLKQGSTESGTTILTDTRAHNFLNGLVSITTAGSGATSSSASLFNLLSKRQQVTLQDGSYWVYAYDGHGQLTSADHDWSDGTPVAGQQFVYNYDDVGNRTSTQAGGDQNGQNLRAATYQADSGGDNQYVSRVVPHDVDVMGTANPLATVTVTAASTIYPTERKDAYYWAQVPVPNNYVTPPPPGTIGLPSSPPAVEDLTITAVLWDYQLGQDVTTTSADDVSLPPSPQNFTYDNNGNLETDGQGDNFYVWDAEKRLIAIYPALPLTVPTTPPTRTIFAYDYLGRRVQKCLQTGTPLEGPFEPGQPTVAWTSTSDTVYVYDGWNLLVELNGLAGTSALPGTPVRSYAWGATDQGALDNAGATAPILVQNYQGPIGTYYLAADVAGNIVSLFNTADGTQAAAFAYGPFGERIQASGAAAAASPFLFAGKYNDLDSGLVYYGHRYYNPSLGRWIGRDPIEEAGGVNLYGFVGNDPINQQDLLGLVLFDQSSSFFLNFLGQAIDPSAYYQEVASGQSSQVLSTYTENVGMSAESLFDALFHPLDTIDSLDSIGPNIASGGLACLLGEKYDEFINGTPQEQMDILAGLSGNAAFAWATGGGSFDLGAAADSFTEEVPGTLDFDNPNTPPANAEQGAIILAQANNGSILQLQDANGLYSDLFLVQSGDNNQLLSIVGHGDGTLVAGLTPSQISSMIQLNGISLEGVQTVQVVACRSGGGFSQALANELQLPVVGNVYGVTVQGFNVGVPSAVIDDTAQLPGVGWSVSFPETP